MQFEQPLTKSKGTMNRNCTTLLHPLAEPLSKLINCRNQATIDFDDPQSVLLNDSIYMKGKCPNGCLRLWKYSLSTKTFSEIQCPKSCCGMDADVRYALTSRNSKLLIIKAYLSYPNDPHMYLTSRPERLFDPDYYGVWEDHKLYHTLRVYIYELSDTRSEELCPYSVKCTDPLGVSESMEMCTYEKAPDYKKYSQRDSKLWDITVASNNNGVVLAFIRQDEYTFGEKCMMSIEEEEMYGVGPFINVKTIIFSCDHIIIVKDGLSLEGTIEENEITKPLLFVYEDNVYMRVWSNFTQNNFYKTSLKSLTDQSSKYSASWHNSCSIPERILNGTFLNSCPVVGVTSGSHDGTQKL